jgi:hypothetical protein
MFLTTFQPDRVRLSFKLGFALFLVALAVPGFTRTSPGWESVYLVAGESLRSGKDIFLWGTGYVYPPFGALLAVPFTFLPPWLAKTAWVALNVFAAFVFIRGAWRLAGLKLPGAPGTGWREHVIVWLGVAAASGLILDVVTNRQTDLLVAALMVGGAEVLLRGRGLTAGTMFGLAAALKCAPLLWAPYLAWKRKWLPAAMVFVTFLGVNYLPDVLYPQPEAPRPRLLEWGRRMIVPMSWEKFDPGQWTSSITFNHSLAGVMNRWCLTDRLVIGKEVLSFPKTDRMSAAELKKLIGLASLVLTLVGLACMLRRGRRVEDGATTGTAAEIGMVLSLLLLLSPMSSKPHFCTLLLPQWLLARLAWERRDRFLMVLTAAVAVVGLLANKDLVGGLAYGMLLWHGSVFGACLALYFGCGYARVRYAEPVPEMKLAGHIRQDGPHDTPRCEFARNAAARHEALRTGVVENDTGEEARASSPDAA